MWTNRFVENSILYFVLHTTLLLLYYSNTIYVSQIHFVLHILQQHEKEFPRFYEKGRVRPTLLPFYFFVGDSAD